MDFKIIKQKDFSFKDKLTGNDVNATQYSVSHKGRSLGVSTLRWEPANLSVSEDKTTLTLKGDLELRKETTADQLTGEVREFLSIYPKMDIPMSA